VRSANGGVVEGRTVIQKLCYFAGLALDEDLGYHARGVERIVGELGRLVPGFHQRPLSPAAKVDLILRQQGAMLATEIPAMATRLGWKVSDDEVTHAITILVGLNHVAPPQQAGV
jgi:hypothetical protein